MGDSDEDIVVLEEIKNDKSSRKWKWNVPNPNLVEGTAEKILKKVRNKLNMENPEILMNINDSSSQALIENKKQPNSTSQINADQVQKTPQKSSSSNAPLSLTPEQIQELTENCLDSDNEPDITPTKSSLQSQEQKYIKRAPPKRALSFGLKASNGVRNRASKFFGAGTSQKDVEEILAQGDGSHARTVSPTKSPAAKKKRLSKNSPIRLLPSHRNLGKSPGRYSPGKSPGRSPGKSPVTSPSKSPRRSSGFQSPMKGSPRSGVLRNLNAETETEVVPGGPYYSEAFCHIMKKVSNNPGYQHLFLNNELKKLKEIDRSTQEFQLYVRLMNRKDKWNRTSDIRYNDISEDLTPLFDALEKQHFISCDLSDEKLEVLLKLLKMEELKTLCNTFKVKKMKNKPDLIESLLQMQRTQPTFGGSSPMTKSVKGILGRCVRLTMAWRLVFRRCILLFSMFHSFEDLDKLSSEQALLLLQVKNENMVFPVSDTNIQSCTQIFVTRDQLIRYEEAKEVNQELNIAMETKNNQMAEDLTRKCMKQFSTLLELTSETDHVLNLPQHLQKFCAGSTYAYALTRSVDAMKQGRKYELALDVLKLLLDQKTYCLHYHSRWSLMLSALLHINLKDIVGACKVLCSVMKDRKLLSPVDHMHLQQRAEKVFKLKKNGLSQEFKDQLASVMDPPCKPPQTVEICARAFVSSKPGLKKVYIRDTEEGKEFMSVEETVLAHYKTLGFINGIHDEGSIISSLCLLAVWDYIYDVSVPSVFFSPYQDKPLDWGSRAFYESRKKALEAHFANLLLEDVRCIAEQLCECRSQHMGVTSVINWDRLEKLDICAFLECVSVPVFVAVSRRLIEDWKSHRSGFPDLIVWSPPQKKCLFIEVKSPNDTLSTVQYLWLDFLRRYNANAIVAHIRESGSKSLQ